MARPFPQEVLELEFESEEEEELSLLVMVGVLHLTDLLDHLRFPAHNSKRKLRK